MSVSCLLLDSQVSQHGLPTCELNILRSRGDKLTGRFTGEMANASAALLSAAFIGIVPGYISRSVAGSYDNEAIAIFLLMFTFYLWIKAVKTGSATYGTLTALFYGWMVAAWGGYVFITNSAFHFLNVADNSDSSPRVRLDLNGPIQQPTLHCLFILVCSRYSRLDASSIRRVPTHPNE